MFRSLGLRLRNVRKALLYHMPVEIFEERVHIRSFSLRTMVEQVGMLPYIKRKKDRKCHEMALVLLFTKADEELFCDWVEVEK